MLSSEWLGIRLFSNIRLGMDGIVSKELRLIVGTDGYDRIHACNNEYEQGSNILRRTLKSFDPRPYPLYSSCMRAPTGNLWKLGMIMS